MKIYALLCLLVFASKGTQTTKKALDYIPTPWSWSNVPILITYLNLALLYIIIELQDCNFFNYKYIFTTVLKNDLDLLSTDFMLQ